MDYVSDRNSRQLSQNEVLPEADLHALWRLESGALRIDSEAPDGRSEFAHLALPGDYLGVESLAGMPDSLTVRAITPARLVPVIGGRRGAANPGVERCHRQRASALPRGGELANRRGGRPHQALAAPAGSQRARRDGCPHCLHPAQPQRHGLHRQHDARVGVPRVVQHAPD
jgi:hypothetical protein